MQCLFARLSWPGQKHLLSEQHPLQEIGVAASHAHFPPEAHAFAGVNGAQQAKGYLPHHREVLRGVVLTGAASVLAKTHVQRPVEVVLYRPMPADYPAEFRRRTVTAADVIPAGHLCLAGGDAESMTR